MTANEVLTKLQSVASDDEAQMIENLAVEAGLWWRCLARGTDGPRYECRCVNCIDEKKCGWCGARKPRK